MPCSTASGFPRPVVGIRYDASVQFSIERDAPSACLWFAAYSKTARAWRTSPFRAIVCQSPVRMRRFRKHLLTARREVRASPRKPAPRSQISVTETLSVFSDPAPPKFRHTPMAQHGDTGAARSSTCSPTIAARAGAPDCPSSSANCRDWAIGR